INGFQGLSARLGEAVVFCGDRTRQVTTGPFRHGGGQVFAVDDLDSALRALTEIVQQGEGAAHRDVWDGDVEASDPTRREVAHYFRFQELKVGRRYQPGD